MFDRILTFFSNIFLIPESPPLFSEFFVDKNPEYVRAMGDYWALDGTFVALEYTSSLKQEIEAYKYLSQKDKKNLFVPYLSECFRFFCLENIDRDALICPVPIHFFSRLRRGYNQSELLARDIAKKEGISFACLLRKSHFTKHQARLSKQARLHNVRGSFSVPKKKIPALLGKDIILIDDIISTGSTVNECAHVLKNAGAKRVFCLCIATGDSSF